MRQIFTASRMLAPALALPALIWAASVATPAVAGSPGSESLVVSSSNGSAPAAGTMTGTGSNQMPAGGIVLDTDITRGQPLERPAGTIIVGNPSIADVTLRDDQFMLLTGRSPGRTNLIVYDPDGEQIADYTLIVRSAASYMTVHRGNAVRQHYDCVPRCERVVRIDDDSESIKTQATNIKTSGSLITGGASQGAAIDAAAGQQ